VNKDLSKLILWALIWLIGVYGIFLLPDYLLFLCGIFYILFIILGFVFTFVGSIKYIIIKKDFFGFIPITMLASIVLILLFFSPTDIKKEFSYQAKVEKRNEVVNLIRKGEVERDSNNYVWLTEEYNDLSESSYLYVPVLEEDKALVGFLFKAGIPDEDLWLVYSSCGEDLIKDNIDTSLYSSITMKEENWYFVQFK